MTYITIVKCQSTVNTVTQFGYENILNTLIHIILEKSEKLIEFKRPNSENKNGLTKIISLPYKNVYEIPKDF